MFQVICDNLYYLIVYHWIVRYCNLELCVSIYSENLCVNAYHGINVIFPLGEINYYYYYY